MKYRDDQVVPPQHASAVLATQSYVVDAQAWAAKSSNPALDVGRLQICDSTNTGIDILSDHGGTTSQHSEGNKMLTQRSNKST